MQGFSQVQRQTQSLVLAPQLRQSLKILQVPQMELRQTIQEELSLNPTLEELAYDDLSIEAQEERPREESDDWNDPALDVSMNGTSTEHEVEKPAETTEAAEKLEFSDDFNVLDRRGSDWGDLMHQEAGEMPYTSEDAKRRQHFFDSLTGGTSIQESLMEQARMSESDAPTLAALEYLIGSLDDRGFLSTPLPDLALMAQVPLKTMQEASRLLKTLEPPGIGSENLQECLLIQLRLGGHRTSLTSEIVRDHWKLLVRRRLPEIARKLDVTLIAVENAVEIIKKLDPAPGRQFSEDTNRVIEPDVTIDRDEMDEWEVTVHNDYIPRLRVSQAYKEMLAQGRVRGKDREYLQERIRSGKFLISSIEQRQQTIERIARVILDRQADFFDHGTSKLRPLTMNQVAEVVGVHETTVSRAIANKYMRTPHGVFDFKYFFTPGYENEEGESFSNKSIKERVAKIIENEPPNKPYSDQAVVGILADEGVTIARRTVAKYREELGILPTNLRRRYA